MRRLRGERFRWLLQVGGVELAQIPRHALLDLSEAALHLGAREILVAVVDRFELAAVDGNARFHQQAHLSAKCDELRAHLAYRRPVILAEISNRLDANRIILANPILQALRKQRVLPALRALNKALHLIPLANR